MPNARYNGRWASSVIASFIEANNVTDDEAQRVADVLQLDKDERSCQLTLGQALEIVRFLDPLLDRCRQGV